MDGVICGLFRALFHTSSNQRTRPSVAMFDCGAVTVTLLHFRCPAEPDLPGVRIEITNSPQWKRHDLYMLPHTDTELNLDLFYEN